MHIEYLHQQGGYTHQGPSGTLYDFAPGVDGRRIAEVTDPTDQARFLGITDLMGRPLFAALPNFEPPLNPMQLGGTAQETEQADHFVDANNMPGPLPADHFPDARNMVEEPAKPKPKARKARYAPDPADVSASLD